MARLDFTLRDRTTFLVLMLSTCKDSRVARWETVSTVSIGGLRRRLTSRFKNGFPDSLRERIGRSESSSRGIPSLFGFSSLRGYGKNVPLVLFPASYPQGRLTERRRMPI